MKFISTLILVIILSALGVQFYRLYEQHQVLAGNALKLKDEAVGIEAENQRLQADLVYFAQSANLEKELRGRLNYKKPGEKLIIIVPTSTPNH